MQQLLLEVDLAHVDGRAKLAALATPLFARMPDGVYRELLADRLAGQIRMPAAKLKEHLFAGAGTGAARARNAGAAGPALLHAEPTSAKRSRMSAGRGKLLTQAIALVLHHPAAARAVADPGDLGAVVGPGGAVLKELLEQAAGMAKPSTAMLLERWRERAEYARLSELAMAEPLVADAAGAASELQMAVSKLLEAYGPGRRMDELLRKSEEMGLNFDEKAELSRLLQMKDRPRAPS